MLSVIKLRDFAIRTDQIAAISAVYPAQANSPEPGVRFDIIMLGGNVERIVFPTKDRDNNVDQTLKDAEQSRAALFTQWTRWMEAENVEMGCTNDNLEIRQCYVKGGEFHGNNSEKSNEKSS